MDNKSLQSDFVKAGLVANEGEPRVLVFRKTLYRVDLAHYLDERFFGVLDPVPLATLPTRDLAFPDFVKSVQDTVVDDHTNSPPCWTHGIPRYHQYLVDVHGDTGLGPFEEDIWPMVAEVELKNGDADTSPVAIYDLRQKVRENLEVDAIGAMGESFEDVYGVFFKDAQESRDPMGLQPDVPAYRQQMELF